MIVMNMYQKIQNCKKQLLAKNQTASKLKISWKTVKKYWDMTEEEYLKYKMETDCKVKVFEPFKSDIISLLEVNKDILNNKVFASSIYDVLEEKYGTLPGGERTLRRYISYIKETSDFDCSKGIRFYTPVDELPFGKQLQLDFGETKINSGEKVYIFATVLSASRFKYVSVQDRPFKTVDVIRHLLDCFDCIGGIPEEIAIDQDKVMVVSENNGDIILTKTFSDFKNEQGFKLFVCRKADPETKGKVENLVKFIKTSFFSAREFNSTADIPLKLEKWLIRRANGKISMGNGCVPMDLISKEREALNPLRLSIYRTERVVDREPRKVYSTSLISVGSSYYSVPRKYIKKTVWIYQTNNKVLIYNEINGDLIASHNLSLLPGVQVIDKMHIRMNKQKLSYMKEQLDNALDSVLWKKFIDKQYSNFNRYFRDNYPSMLEFVKTEPDIDILEEAIELCFDIEKYSTNSLKESYKYVEGKKLEVIPDIIPSLIKNVTHVKNSPEIKKRNLKYYSSLFNLVGGII